MPDLGHASPLRAFAFPAGLRGPRASAPPGPPRAANHGHPLQFQDTESDRQVKIEIFYRSDGCRPIATLSVFHQRTIGLYTYLAGLAALSVSALVGDDRTPRHGLHLDDLSTRGPFFNGRSRSRRKAVDAHFL